MPYRLTPQDIVTMLEECLQNVGTMTEEKGPMEDIKEKLEAIKVYYPNLKDLEQTIVDEFKKIGSAISGDDVLKKHDDAVKVKQRLQDIDKILLGIKKISEQNKISLAAKRVPGRQDSFFERQAMEESLARHWSESDLEWMILESQAMSSLKVCFENLDYRSRLCSLCLSIFPEKFEIKKRPLIYWWMGEGFVRGTFAKVAEEEGEDIFNKLCRKGLVQPVYKGRNPVVDSCSIHPWVRKMLITVAKEAQFLDFDMNGWLKDTFDGSRRACLVEAKGRSKLKDLKNLDMLAVVFNVDKKYLQLESELWSNLRRIKALQLGRWQRSREHHIELEIIGDTKKKIDNSQEALINLGALKQLKYLSLQGISRVSDLPASISELLNLEILDLRACHNLGRLPSTIGSLHNLTHLDVTECYFLENMPKGIEKLSSLQVLKGFMLGTYQTNSCKLRDLARLTKLRKLSIYIRNKAHNIEEQGDFRGNEILRSLTITWGGGTSGTQQTTQTKSIEFPKSLEKLDLRCYPFNKAPEWLSPLKLKELKKLYIRGGWLESLNDPESNDTYDGLQILRLKYLKNMKVSFERNQKDVPSICINGKDKEFPSLEYYETAKVEDGDKFEIEEWTKVHGFQSFTKTEII
ncbi:hypothetical protein QQ045_025915 [Rhodiola kirilowii]